MSEKTPGWRTPASVALERGTVRKLAEDSWQIRVFAGIDATSDRERRVTRTIHAPHNKAGRKIVDQALAALIVEVETGRINLGEDPTPTSCSSGGWPPGRRSGHRRR